jgi:hypothetical protein
MAGKISMVDFLKRYTSIPNKFIDEHYKFYEMCNSDTFGIDCDDIIAYLAVTSKKKFRERVRDNYKINIDYIRRNFTDNVRDVKYFVTFNCFENICAASATKKGAETRDYFTIIRKFINYYRHHFSQTIETLAKNDKYMYILLVNKGKNIFKVGGTSNIRKRMFAYATGRDVHPDIHFIMIVDDPIKIEKCVKNMASDSRYKANKELYKVDYNSLKKAIANCAIMQDDFIDDIARKGDYDSYVVYDESKNVKILDANNKVIGYEKGILTIKSKKNKVASKPITRSTSKKTSKVGSKRITRLTNKKTSKVGSKRVTRLTGKKTSKVGSKRVTRLTSKKTSKVGSKQITRSTSKKTSKVGSKRITRLTGKKTSKVGSKRITRSASKKTSKVSSKRITRSNGKK